MFISSSPTGKHRTKAGFTVLTRHTVSSVLEEASGILSAEILIDPSAWKRCSPKFAVLAWECEGFVVRVSSWARAKVVTRCAQAGGRSMHRVRCARDEPRGTCLLWAGLRLSRGGDEGRARESSVHCGALRRDRSRGA